MINILKSYMNKMLFALAAAPALLLFLGADTLLAQTSYFTDLPIYSTLQSNITFSVALGDVDGDGDLDLVCGNNTYFGHGGTSLYENIGGTFSSVPIWSRAESYERSVALGDVDGDGDLDLVCGSGGAGYSSVKALVLYLNDNGILAAQPAWASDSSFNTRSVALGDVDDDGDLDLVCGGYNISSKLFENTGGTFTGTPIWSSDSTYWATSVALGDVDDDGDLDLACGIYRDSNILFENTGGTFTTLPVWVSDSTHATTSVAFGDVDGDGDLDLVCGNWYAFESNTLYENAGGTLSNAPVWLSTPVYATESVVLGDVDGDGDLDFLSGSRYGAEMLYENTGGTFSVDPAWSSSSVDNTYSIALGDIDGDGDFDLACGNEEINTVYENIGAAFAEEPGWSAQGYFEIEEVALGDVDGDGDLDLACGLFNDMDVVYENTGDTLSNILWRSNMPFSTFSVALGDVDGDGAIDLVTAGEEIGIGEWAAIKHYRNTGGSFTAMPVWYADTAYTHEVAGCVALGDVDGDDDLDLVCGYSGQSNTLYENTGGIFTNEPVWYSSPANRTQSIALGDVDGDGDLDLVCGNHSEINTLYENSGGTFSTYPSWSTTLTNSTHSIALGDVDGDGDLDLVCGNYEQRNTLYENVGGALSTIPVWFSRPTNRTSSIALADVDGDGDLDLVCGNSNSYEGNTIYENTGGALSNDPIWVDNSNIKTTSFACGDVDRDGDMDIVCGLSPTSVPQITTLFTSIKNPAFKGDPLAPAHQLPNNGTFISFASCAVPSGNNFNVEFTVHDVESDRIRIAAEYQFAGEHHWYPAMLTGGGNVTDTIAATPEGVLDSLEWDITTVPFDHRDVVLRLRTIEIPRYVSVIQHAATYLTTIGRIVPIRPELRSSADSLLFSHTAVTVGDTISLDLFLSNTGTADLLVSQITLPSTEMRIDRATPFILQPGSADTAAVFLEPRIETNISGEITISSDDPVTPVRSIVVTSDIRSLDVTSEVLKTSDAVPLGDAVTVVVTPAPFVHVEGGYIYVRETGMPAFADSFALLPFKDEFVALIPGEYVTEAGFDYYVRVENSGVFGTDPVDAPVAFYTQAVESPAGISSEAVPNAGSDYLAGRDIKVYAILPTGAQFQRGALHYREGGATQYLIDSLALEDVFPEASIPDSLVTARGVDYWVEIVTMTSRLSDPPADPSRYPHTLPITVQNLIEAHSHPGGETADAYRMMSIPLRFGEDFTGTLEALLSDQPEFGSYDPTRWRAWVYIPESGSYGELNDPSLAERFRPDAGRAYWLISKDDHRISTAPISGFSTHTGGPSAIELAGGMWNMIGSPYAYPVSWDSVKVDTFSMEEAVGVVIDPPLRWAGGYRSDIIALEPFEGYWIFNRMDHPVTLSIPPVEAIHGVTVEIVTENTVVEGWRMSLIASMPEAYDMPCIIGMSPGASDGIDRFDRMKPPPAPDRFLSLYILNEGPGRRNYPYRVDMRSIPSGESEWGAVWVLDVMKSFAERKAGDEVTIAVDSLMQLPAGAAAVIIDRVLAREIDCEAHAEYRFNLGERGYVSSEDEARFRLIVGTQNFVQEESDRLIDMPNHTALYQNYPNPFNPSTLIKYEIADPGFVSIRIYDVTGTLVKVLEERHHDRGRYEIGWNGDNDGGARVASGIYFYRLVAGDFLQTKKMVLLR